MQSCCSNGWRLTCHSMPNPRGVSMSHQSSHTRVPHELCSSTVSTKPFLMAHTTTCSALAHGNCQIDATCSAVPHPTCQIAAMNYTRPKRSQTTTCSAVPRFTRAYSPPQTTQGSTSDSEMDVPDYRTQGVPEIVSSRLPIQGIFMIGLLAAGIVIERFEDVLQKHVELSFFLPLIMGHGGNSGSQTVSELIRAQALRQVRWKRGLPVIVKETVSGGVMGGVLGLVIYGLSLVWNHLSSEVGLTVAIALPLVSMWSTALAAFTTLASSKLKLDPAMTSGPLVATLVDTTGIIIYFMVAQAIMRESLDAGSLVLCSAENIC